VLSTVIQVAPSYDLAHAGARFRVSVSGMRNSWAASTWVIFLIFLLRARCSSFPQLQRRHVLSVSQRPHFRIVCAGSFLRGIDMVPSNRECRRRLVWSPRFRSRRHLRRLPMPVLCEHTFGAPLLCSPRPFRSSPCEGGRPHRESQYALVFLADCLCPS